MNEDLENISLFFPLDENAKPTFKAFSTFSTNKPHSHSQPPTKDSPEENPPLYWYWLQR
jgi:hypothetical protein